MARSILIALLLVSASTFAAHDRYVEYSGILHNNAREGRATLESGRSLFLLEYDSGFFLDVGERHDRERVIVRGTLDDAGFDRFPGTIRVESITFRPYSGAAVTYRSRPRRYTTYETRYEPSRYNDDDYGGPSRERRVVIRRY